MLGNPCQPCITALGLQKPAVPSKPLLPPLPPPSPREFEVEEQILRARPAQPFEVRRHFTVSDEFLDSLSVDGRRSVFLRRSNLPCTAFPYSSHSRVAYLIFPMG